MAQCNICKTETELYYSGVPICIACATDKGGAGDRHSQHQPKATLRDLPEDLERSTKRLG